MQALIKFDSNTGNEIYILADKISAFCYEKEKDATTIWLANTGDGCEFVFKGNHVSRIIEAINFLEE